MQIAFHVLLFVLGACFGSFLCCQVRRLELKDQNSKYKPKSRSVCLHCHYQLKWYDNIPILSWLFLRGKCRKCHKKIGLAELISELGMALAFLALSTTIDITTISALEWAIFVVTLMLTIILGFLAIYDGIYGKLPFKYLIFSVIIATIILTLKTISSVLADGSTLSLIYNPILSVLILGGLYYALFRISHSKWVGDGDWLLGLSIGLALCHPWLALVALFLANLTACIIMYPIIRKKKHPKIYFGPFMVVAFILTTTFSNFFYYAIGM